MGIIGRRGLILAAAILFTAASAETPPIAQLPKEYTIPQRIDCPPGNIDAEKVAFQEDYDSLLQIRLSCYVSPEPIEAVMFFTERDITQDNPTLAMHSFSGWKSVDGKQVAFYMVGENIGQIVLSSFPGGGTFMELFKLTVPGGR